MDTWSHFQEVLSDETDSSSASAHASGSGWHGDDEEHDGLVSESDFVSMKSGRSTFGAPCQGDYFVNDGRAYNSTSWTYRFPADQEEIIRQDRQHYLLCNTLPGLYRGPVDEVLTDGPRRKRILDVGCGTGSWTSEMAERWPEVDCVGVDIMPLQHDHQLLNCTYMCVEVPQGLHIFPRRSFDVVHVRQMLYSIADYPRMIAECHRLLRPGGLIMVHECEFRLYSIWQDWEPHQLSPTVAKWVNLVKRAFEYRGIDLSVYFRMKDILSAAGFDRDSIDTYAHYRQICPDDSTTELGQNEAAHSEAFFRASRLSILEAGLMRPEEWDEFQEEGFREIRGQASGLAGPLGPTGLLLPWGYWWARKPR